MNWFDIFKKAFGMGILSTLVYHGTLLMIGQPVTLKNVILFTVVFIGLYFLWLLLASKGRKG
ncbi:hypothetical protein [Anaerotignum propionicum]|nr:hypothetical protein [Anaerotignum propionicum]